MTERVIRFGPDDSLLGILNVPEHWSQQSPVAVILNAGIVHRAGPFRLHVDLARALSDVGHASLRMDLSGLGDSETRKVLPEGEDRARLDFRDAMRALEEVCGATTFVPLGLCSGAYNAHQVAIDSGRIVGGVFLDGIVYETEGHRRRVRKRRMGYRFLRNAVKRRVSSDLLQSDKDENEASAEFFTNDKSSGEVGDEIRTMLNREMQLLFIYTEGYKEISGSMQFEEMFGIVPNQESLQVDYYENVEHTFRLTQNRKRVVDRIANWLHERFPAKSEDLEAESLSAAADQRS